MAAPQLGRDLVVPGPRREPPIPQDRSAFAEVARAPSVTAACHAVTDRLLELGFELPSVYLLAGRRLRCHSARGYFQVVDGFAPGKGVIGRVVAAGEPDVISDVRLRPEFVVAIPGVRAEACTPIRLGEAVVGAVNVESCSSLPDDVAEVLAAAASALAHRFEQIGGLPSPQPSQRLAQVAVELTAATGVGEIEQRAVRAAVELSGMSSAAIVHVGHEPGSQVTTATGPLGRSLRSWTAADLDTMAGWVGQGTSTHFPGGEDVPGEYQFLRRAGIRAVSVLPLTVGGQVHGLIVVADAEPVPHTSTVVDLLDLLAAQTAASIGMATVLRDMRTRADRDQLTGLFNRRGFSALLERAIEHSRNGEQLAVLLFDLDDFKHVNDSLGHLAGDRLLVEIAGRLASVLRSGDVACRLGGDEFVVVLPDTDERVALAVADRLLVALASVTLDDDLELAVTASVGIALTGGDRSTPEQLLGAADLAMYAAKSAGKGRCTVFREAMQASALRRMSLVRDLRRALRDGALTLAYQPVVALRDGRVVAVEALARWDDPARGPVPAGEFVRLAEETGDIAALGAWVLRTACGQLRRWLAAGHDLAMCVNVSTRQLERGTLLAALDECLDAGTPPARIMLEITETALADDSGQAQHVLRQVRARGVQLAVDDFGTGYSSLGRLRSAPVDRLKVDRSFVHEIGDGVAGAPIVDAALAMAAGLGLQVVAEGVETTGQLDYLRQRGCAYAQGYLLARPLPAGEVTRLLGRPSPWPELFSRPARPASRPAAAPGG